VLHANRNSEIYVKQMCHRFISI